jgi:hypothetical protein
MWPVTSEQGEKGDHGPVWKSMYTACSTQLTTGLACTLSLTREYMEHGGCLPANYALTVYYLPVYPPYSDSNYGLWSLVRVWHCGSGAGIVCYLFDTFRGSRGCLGFWGHSNCSNFMLVWICLCEHVKFWFF